MRRGNRKLYRSAGALRRELLALPGAFLGGANEVRNKQGQAFSQSRTNFLGDLLGDAIEAAGDEARQGGDQPVLHSAGDVRRQGTEQVAHAIGQVLCARPARKGCRERRHRVARIDDLGEHRQVLGRRRWLGAPGDEGAALHEGVGLAENVVAHRSAAFEVMRCDGIAAIAVELEAFPRRSAVGFIHADDLDKLFEAGKGWWQVTAEIDQYVVVCRIVQ